MSKSMINDMTEGSITRQLISFSLPLILSQALQTAYNLADMVIVGQYTGSSGISAVSIGGNLLWTLTALSLGYCGGGQIYISQQVGHGEKERISRTIGSLFSVTLLLGLAFSLAGVFFCDGLLRILNTPEDAFAEAHNYVFICTIGLVCVYGYNMVSAILRGMGDSKRPFIFISAAAVLNILLDLAFVGGLGMGAGGAALATVISQGASFVFSLIYLYAKRAAFGFDFRLKSFRIHIPTLRAMSKLGIPIAFQTVAINLSILFINSYVNTYGLVYSALYGIGGKLNNVMFIITNAMNSAGGAMIGQNFSAGRFDRIKKIIRLINTICMGFFVIVSVPCLIWPRAIFGIFTADTAVLEYAGQYMYVSVVMFFTFAAMQSYLSLMSGVGNGTLYLIVALADGVVARILLSVIMAGPCGMGVWGYFWGSALAGFVTIIWSIAYYYSGVWKKRKLLLVEE